jgi:hypothetical protein
VPQSVTIGSITATSAVISWTAPANNGGSAITGYDISMTCVFSLLSDRSSPSAIG